MSSHMLSQVGVLGIYIWCSYYSYNVCNKCKLSHLSEGDCHYMENLNEMLATLYSPCETKSIYRLKYEFKFFKGNIKYSSVGQIEIEEVILEFDWILATL